MAKATMMLDGASVTIEGSEGEIAALLARFSARGRADEPRIAHKGRRTKGKSGPMGLI